MRRVSISEPSMTDATPLVSHSGSEVLSAEELAAISQAQEGDGAPEPASARGER